MIVIDLDGTLLSPTGTVTPRSKQAVHRALSAGLMVCFATGRNWTESRTVLEAVSHYSTAVFAGGAMVVDTENRIVLHRTMMQPDLAAQTCRIFERAGHCALALQDVAASEIDYLVSSTIPMNDATASWSRIVQPTIHPVPDLQNPARHQHTMRVSIVASPADVEQLKQQLANELGERALVMKMHVPTYGVDILEVFDPGINKWEGVMHIARQHAIEPSEIIAIGDDVNDVPMLRNAGLGVAMGNATPAALAVADRVIGTNREEGLAQFLEELVASHAVEPMTGVCGTMKE